jgi:uncharacterized damage-inducible protein DinB
MSHRPNANEYAPYYHTYVGKVSEGELIQLLTAQIEDTLAIFAGISEEQGGYRYAEGKWSIKEVLNHLIDTERVMAYRALAVGRGDKTALPGFDQDDYVASFDANKRTVAEMAAEFKIVRQSSIALFQSFTDKMMQEVGTASGFPISARALAYIILGHELHHVGILKERYL